MLRGLDHVLPVSRHTLALATYAKTLDNMVQKNWMSTRVDSYRVAQCSVTLSCTVRLLRKGSVLSARECWLRHDTLVEDLGILFMHDEAVKQCVLRLLEKIDQCLDIPIDVHIFCK